MKMISIHKRDPSVFLGFVLLWDLSFCPPLLPSRCPYLGNFPLQRRLQSFQHAMHISHAVLGVSCRVTISVCCPVNENRFSVLRLRITTWVLAALPDFACLVWSEGKMEGAGFSKEKATSLPGYWANALILKPLGKFQRKTSFPLLKRSSTVICCLIREGTVWKCSGAALPSNPAGSVCSLVAVTGGRWLRRRPPSPAGLRLWSLGIARRSDKCFPSPDATEENSNYPNPAPCWDSLFPSVCGAERHYGIRSEGQSSVWSRAPTPTDPARGWSVLGPGTSGAKGNSNPWNTQDCRFNPKTCWAHISFVSGTFILLLITSVLGGRDCRIPLHFPRAFYCLFL